MTNEEYQLAQNNLMLLGKIVAQTDWNEFIERINKAESFGFVVDPTLYRAGEMRLRLIKDMGRDALHLKMHFEQLQEQVKSETEVKEYNP